MNNQSETRAVGQDGPHIGLLQAGKTSVGVIGLGYVGLPLAVTAARPARLSGDWL